MTSAIQVRPIDPSKAADVRTFDQVPFVLNAGSPYWVPPAPGEVRAALDHKRHPYYQHSEAGFFVAEQHGRPAGRIAICHHRPYRAKGSNAAYFNFLETSDDEGVAAGLLKAAGDWAKARGLTEMVGPVDFFHANGIGVLVEGFDQVPIPAIPYNGPHVDGLLQRQGLVRQFDLLSGTMKGKSPLPAGVVRMAEHLAAEGGVRILHPQNRQELWHWMPRLSRLMQEYEIPGQVNAPMTDAEWQHLVAHFWPIADPGLVKLAVRGEEVIGVLFGYVNLSAALRRARGRLWPFGWFHLWRALKACRRVVINGLTVSHAFRGSGVNLLLYFDMFRTLQSRPAVDEVEIVQVGEHNVRSFGDMSRLGVRWSKRHRVYTQTLSA